MTMFCVNGFCQQTDPEPVSGRNLTKDYIQRNILYPKADLEQNRSGSVVVAFNVKKDGTCSDYRIASSFSDAASVVAMDMVKRILWNAGKVNGVPVDSETQYQVDFSTKTYNRYWKKHHRAEIPLQLEADSSYKIFSLHQLEENAIPYFENGISMAEYIAGNLKYPESAKASEIQGTVRLKFVVETDGSVSNITIEKSVGGGCDNEAVRLIQETRWIPAIKDGKYVRSRNEQDITFRIGNRNFQDGNSY